MTSKSNDLSQREQRLQEALVACIDAAESGRSDDREALLARYPEFATELREFFAGRSNVERLAQPLRPHVAAGSADAPTTGLSETSTMPAPGARIQYFGDYELLDEIGRGGMGVVYKARQVSLKRVVALKMILTGQLANDDDVKRFYAEAEAAAKLQHDGIVPVFEVGKYEGHHYFTMAFIEGESLAHKLSDGMLSPRQAAELTKKIAKAVSYAHTEGVIHRDLKPANILLDKHGEPHLTDFGLAKRVTAEPGAMATGGLTVTGQILGTPSYMPPEQASGQRGLVGPLADVYSLGAILYCLLTARPPFQADNPFDTLMQVVEHEPVAPRQLNAKIPRDLETICLKCLQKEPRKRYGSAQDLAADLNRFLEGQPILARPAGRLERIVKFARRRPAAAVLTVVLASAWIPPVVTAMIFVDETNQARVEAINSTHSANLATKNANEAFAEADRQRKAANQARYEAELDRAEAKKEKERADIAAKRIGKDLYVADLRLAQKAWEEARLFRVQELLEGQRPEKTVGVDLRGFEWQYLKRLSRTDLFTLTDWGSISVAYSPDGKLLATSGYNRVLTISDAATGKKLFDLKGHGGVVVWRTAFSPDSKRLVSGTGEFGSGDVGELKIWDVTKGELIRDLKGHSSAITGLAFSPDGKTVASSSSDKTVRLWDAHTGEEVFKIEAKNRANGVAFSPDGQRLAYVDEYNEAAGNSAGDVKIWNLASRKEYFVFKTNAAGRLFGVAFHPDSRRVAAVGDRMLKIWDIPMARELLSLEGGIGRNSGVAFSKDGQQVASASGSILKVWDATTGKELRAYKGHTYDIISVAFSPDGQRLASAGGGGVKVWDLAKSQEPLTIQNEKGYWFGGAAFSPDGKRLAVGVGDGAVKVFDPNSGHASRILKGHSSWVVGVAWSPDGKRLATASQDKTVKLWDATTGEETHTIKGFTSFVNSVAFSPDGTRIVTGSGDNQQTTVGDVKVWDAATGQPVRSFKVSTADASRPFIMSVSFSPDGKWLAAGVTQHSRPKMNHPNGDFFSGAIVVWDAATGEEIAFLPDQHHVNGIAFSRDGTRIASASLSSTLKIWDTSTWKELFTLKGHTNDANSVAFSPDGKRLVSASDDGTVRIWDVTTGQETLMLRAKHGSVRSVAFSPDGHRLAAAGAALNIWDATPRE